MVFYRQSIVSANSEELLTEKTCPICGGTLSRDHFVLLRYSLGTIFDFLFLYALLTLLLLLILLKIEPAMVLLKQLDFSVRTWVIGIGVSCISLPLSYFMEWCSLKADHLTQYNGHLHGLHCPTCGNRFAGVVAFEDDACAEAEIAAEGSCTA